MQNLDIQYTIGLATDVPTTFISVGNNSDPTDDEFADVLLYTALHMLALPSPPQVMTTSYGSNEPYVSERLAVYVWQNSQEGNTDFSCSALCILHAALGARGVSVLFASGDGGVSGLHYNECTTFIPTFPSGCP